jgi:hypothetical protein
MILSSIDRGLETLGVSARLFVYSNLERSLGVKREQILDDPEKLVQGLRMVFGDGSRVLELAIVREIRKLYGIPLEVDNLSQAVRLAKLEQRKLGKDLLHRTAV